ncbi:MULTISPECIES: universal stress protein [Catenuloplanes]|uniref:Nucleotide-binding universal stress UspA family protein n=1 Tax=Catenuloplanes niger TaxID=587534 RepID=A0AAE4CXX6_9ACTN|nr:universal stress protein [Catenuloplanes niger]MDR7325259.1 nucleotide-binding universal stress UspA family protein [Catenuloplanes niger]
MGAFELGTDGPSALVVGVDGSESSLRAAAYALGLARRQRARLFAVYVRREPGAFLTFGGTAVQALVEAQGEVESELLEMLDQQAREWGVDARLVVRPGDPLRVLGEVAEEVRASGIIVGASAGLGHKIAGSLAVRLVRAARWPVTVVP